MEQAVTVRASKGSCIDKWQVELLSHHPIILFLLSQDAANSVARPIFTAAMRLRLSPGRG